jgi:hypothetical protein
MKHTKYGAWCANAAHKRQDNGVVMQGNKWSNLFIDMTNMELFMLTKLFRSITAGLQ